MKEKKTQTTKTFLVKTVCQSKSSRPCRRNACERVRKTEARECDDHSRIVRAERNYKAFGARGE